MPRLVRTKDFVWICESLPRLFPPLIALVKGGPIDEFAPAKVVGHERRARTEPRTHVARYSVFWNCTDWHDAAPTNYTRETWSERAVERFANFRMDAVGTDHKVTLNFRSVFEAQDDTSSVIFNAPAFGVQRDLL
jgi:hypothetical protein